jgi:2-polyprenyl-6-methoxyphenol hydroxylase-like FAD-dependent oxidoreductase
MANNALIVGAGPTGLTMAIELLRLGVPVRLIDKSLHPTQFSQALVIQARTLEQFSSSLDFTIALPTIASLSFARTAASVSAVPADISTASTTTLASTASPSSPATCGVEMWRGGLGAA